MKTSTERILTTHVGSMPRPQFVVDQLFAQDQGEAYDEVEFDRVMERAVREVAAKQVNAGVDIISDGEMSKISYATYIRHRFTGFEIADVPRATPKDLDDFRHTRNDWRMPAEHPSTIVRLFVARSRSRIWRRWRRTLPICCRQKTKRVRKKPS